MTIAIQRTTGMPKLVAYAAARVDGTSTAIPPRPQNILEVAPEHGWTPDKRGPNFVLGREGMTGELQGPGNVALRARLLIEELRP